MKFERMKIKSNQEEAIEDLSVEYPFAMHVTDLCRVMIPWHWHEEVEFGYVEHGMVEVMTVNGSHIFHEGEAFFNNTNVLCSMRQGNPQEQAIEYAFLFHPIFLGGHYKSIFETKYMNPVLQNKNLDILSIRGETEAQRQMLKKLQQAIELQKSENTEFQMRNLFSEIWLLLLQEIESQPIETYAGNLQNQDRIQTMLSYIHQNYIEKLTLKEIAGSAAISTRECLRCFQNTIHKSPIEYLVGYRLEMAEKLLRDTRLSVTEIGLQTGFSSNAYFGKTFKNQYGMTPAAYRRAE